MTEQEEAVGRQRLEVLTAYEKRLMIYATNRDILHPEGGEHEVAVRDYDELSAMIERLEADPLVPAVRVLDAEQRVVAATERLGEAQTAITKATEEVTDAQAALAALKP